MRVLDVGCGPGRHALALAARGIEVVGVDISQRFVDLATGGAPTRRRPFERLDARALPFDAEFDAAISLCQGAFGLAGGGRRTALDPDGRGARRHGPGRCARGPAGASAPSPPTSRCGSSRTRRPSTPTRGRQPRAHRGRATRPARAPRHDLWTTLLHAPRAPAARRPRAASRSSTSGRCDPGRLRADAARPRPRRAPRRRSRPTGPSRPTRAVPSRWPPVVALRAASTASVPRCPTRPRVARSPYLTKRSIPCPTSSTIRPLDDDRRTATSPARSSPTTSTACPSRTPSPARWSSVEDGQIVEGTVVKVDKDEVLLDIGYKSEGVIPAASCRSATTSTPTRSSASATRSRRSSSRRRTRTAG